ncbi:MAG: hypothetical protein ACYDAS_00970 [Patescibacteria group bacterium]
MKNINILQYKKYLFYLLITGGVLYFFNFSYNLYSASNTQKATLQNQVSILQNKNTQDLLMLKNETAYKQKIQYLYGTIPSNKTILTWAQQEDTMAMLAGLKNQIVFQSAIISKSGISVSGGIAPVTTGPQPLTVNINLQGPFPNVVEFINLLENSYFYTNLTALSINEQPSANIINTSITLVLYTQ